MPGPYVPNPNDPTRPYNNDEVQYGAEELRELKGRVGGAFTCKEVTALTYTLLSTDVANMVRMVNGGTITIPAGLPPGLIGITGAEGTAIVAGDGATLLVPPSLRAALFEDDAFATLMRTNTNEWLIAGNLQFEITDGITGFGG